MFGDDLLEINRDSSPTDKFNANIGAHEPWAETPVCVFEVVSQARIKAWLAFAMGWHHIGV